MKANKFTVKITTLAATAVSLIFILIPFHAFLTVWLNSLVGHYTVLRLWKEILLLGLVGASVYLLAKDKTLLKKFYTSKLNRLIVAYIAVLTIWGAVSYLLHNVTLKALGYGLVVDSRFFVFFLVVSVLVSVKPKFSDTWPRLIMIPAAIVILFGLLQYFVLPYDVLRHVGYNEATIFPYETINHNVNYIRVTSTLRGANPLGAYLVVVLSLVAALWLKQKGRTKLALAIVGTTVLVLTFSRSAWIGFVLALATLLWASLKSKRSQQWGIVGAGVMVVVVIIGVLVLHNTTAFQNTILHTDDKSKIATTSNEGHISALKTGLREVADQPLGRGTGTAGPASVYNANKVRIAENYFVQIAQEVGWVGVALFIAIQLFVARELWRRRQDPLALGLLAALVGVSFINLLSHAWADDTLAYVFWGLAGIALATQAKPAKSLHHEA